MSLRPRLLAGLVVLVAIGLGVAAVVTYEEQRSFLYNRADQQVAAAVGPVGFRLRLKDGRAPRPPAGAGRVPFPPERRNLPGSARLTFEPSGTYGELLSRGGRVIRTVSFDNGQRAASPPRLPTHMPVSELRARAHVFTVDAQRGSGLRYRVAAFRLSDARVLVVAIPLREVDQTLQRLITVEELVAGGVILALVALGWVVIGLGLRPLERMGRVATEIAHGDFARRVTPANPRSEVGRLGLSLNEMLVQIEQAFADRQESEDRLRRFLADASHELRTPLASIRGYAELFRLGAATEPGELERAMARIEAEAKRMGVLVEDLLLLASLDQLPELRRVPVNLGELAKHAAEDARAIAPGREVRLATAGLVRVLGDPDQLRQVLANLTRNALIHTPGDAAITLAIWREGEQAVLEVRDRGPGLPADASDRVFERFWRTEPGRSRGRGGAGLGLAIVKAIVHRHHGEVHAWNDPDGGAVFRVVLPAAAPGASQDGHVASAGRSQDTHSDPVPAASRSLAGD